MERNREKGVPFDVIERYCPKQGENVIMLRTYGEHGHLSCTRYDVCQKEKDDRCGMQQEM